MKKVFRKAVALSMILMCSIPLQAQSLDDLLGSVAGSTSGDGSTGSLIKGLTTVFMGERQATKENLIGTWVYQEPAVVLTSDDILTQTAAKVAAGKIESELQAQLDKYGIQKGMMNVTFKEDGTFTTNVGGQDAGGKWDVKDAKLVLDAMVKTITLTTQLSGTSLQFVTDASKLLDLFKSVGDAASNTELGTITSLLKNVDGMQVGLSFEKQSGSTAADPASIVNSLLK